MFRFVKPTLKRGWRPTWMVRYNGKDVGSVIEIHPRVWESEYKLGDDLPQKLPGSAKTRLAAAKRLVSDDIEKYEASKIPEKKRNTYIGKK